MFFNQNKVLCIALIAISQSLFSCGSTDKPKNAVPVTKSEDYLLTGTSVNNGLIRLLEGQQTGQAVAIKDFVDVADVSKNFSFQISLQDLSEEKGVTLFLYSDEALSTGYGLHFSLDSHGGAETNLVLHLLVNGEEQPGHFHLIEDLGNNTNSIALSIDAHPAEPHLIVMDNRSGDPTSKIIFNSEDGAQLPLAKLGKKWGVKISGNSSMTAPAINEPKIKH